MRRLLAIILLLLTILHSAPSLAQVPPPVPALPDSERRTSYSITASVCSCAVNFALFGDSTDYANWIEVFVNGVRMSQAGNWTLSSVTGTIGSIPLPITNAVLTFTAPQTGTIQIVGARRPRRTSQFNEGTGVPTRNFNVVLSDLTAQNREVWDKINDVTGRGLFSQPGNTIGLLPLPSACQSKFLGFDATGLIPQCSAGGPGSGNVVGPVTSAVGNAALFNNTTGTLLADAGSPPVLTSQLGTAVATFLATPSSANLRAAITDETGTGLAYFQGGALGTPASGVATNLTGTAAGLTAGNATLAATVTTNANLTGPVTSVGNATAVTNNAITRGMEAQGIARSVIGVTGNSTANVADIQLTASQFLGTTAANTSLAGVGYGPAATAAQGQIPGETTTGNATAGNIGEYVVADLVQGSAVSLTTNVTANVTSISLTAGDWDVSAVGSFNGGATTTVTFADTSVSTTSATEDATDGRIVRFFWNNATVFNSVVPNIPLPPTRFSLSSTTTVFLTARAVFATSTATAFGTIRARRVR